MGAWATGIFGNDLSCDVRDAYCERIATGDDVKAATKRVKRQFAEELCDSAEKRVVWIALAATQIKAGEVTDEVRRRALQGIAWCENQEADSHSIPFSRQALAGVRKKLGGPAGGQARPPKPKVAPGEKGEVFAVRFPNSNRESVIIVCGPSGNDRPAHYRRLVLLLELAVKNVTPVSVRQALLRWRPYRRVWHDGPGGPVFGCYDASGKLPARRTRPLLRGVVFPDSFERRLRVLAQGQTHPSADLPYVIEYDAGEWKRSKWTIDPHDAGE
jgi:hypothetical protein